jgi:multimeric flavodoxin WrbA
MTYDQYKTAHDPRLEPTGLEEENNETMNIELNGIKYNYDTDLDCESCAFKDNETKCCQVARDMSCHASDGAWIEEKWVTGKPAK